MRSTPRSGARRRSRSAALIALLAMVAVPGCARGQSDAQGQTGPANGGYLAFADRMQLRLDGLWDESAGRYRSGERETEAMLNGDMLLTHSVAALQGHSGPSRNDDRARRIARALVSAPTFVATLPDSFEDPQRHAPGFVDTMDAGARGRAHEEPPGRRLGWSGWWGPRERPSVGRPRPWASGRAVATPRWRECH